jgi:hypothetical protein
MKCAKKYSHENITDEIIQSIFSTEIADEYSIENIDWIIALVIFSWEFVFGALRHL